MFNRYIYKQILNSIEPGRVTVIYGPRRVGKTVLLKKIQTNLDKKTVYINGEDMLYRGWLESQNSLIFKENLGDTEVLIIDEAQHINSIGLNLKIMVDTFPNLIIIVSGSSSFELANQIGEPLVDRKTEFKLYPLAQMELKDRESLSETRELLTKRLIFGSYPKVLTAKSNNQKEKLLLDLINNYLIKDVLSLDKIKKSNKIIDLLRLVAHQIGKEVSISELSRSLKLNFQTVERYLDLMEKTWIITRVGGFSSNLRKEITKNYRYYFIDNGVRNALIQNFNEPNLRNDIGELWENYIFIERMKKRTYIGPNANYYFWRTYSQQEIDLVEERGGNLYGFEFKWSIKKNKTAPSEWLKSYRDADYSIINPDNYLDFISWFLSFMNKSIYIINNKKFVPSSNFDQNLLSNIIWYPDDFNSHNDIINKLKDKNPYMVSIFIESLEWKLRHKKEYVKLTKIPILTLYHELLFKRFYESYGENEANEVYRKWLDKYNRDDDLIFKKEIEPKYKDEILSKYKNHTKLFKNRCEYKRERYFQQ